MSAINVVQVMGGSFLGGLAQDIASKIIDDAIGSTVRSAFDWLKFKIGEDWLRAQISEFYQQLIAESHVTLGLSPNGLIDLTMKAMETTIKLGLVMDQEVTEELIMELIQEGFSQAIQFTISGALQHMLGYYRGAYPLQVGETDQAFSNIDNIDYLSAVLLLASSGEHTAVLYYRAIAGLAYQIQQYLSLNQALIVERITRLNNIVETRNNVFSEIAGHAIRRATTILEEYFDNLLAMVRNIVERAVGRLNELMSEADSIYYLYQNGLVDADSVTNTIIEDDVLMDSVKTNFDDIYNLILQELNNAVTAYTVDATVYTTADDVLGNIYYALAEFFKQIRLPDTIYKVQAILARISALRETNAFTIQITPAQKAGPGYNPGAITILGVG